MHEFPKETDLPQKTGVAVAFSMDFGSSAAVAC